MNEVGGYRRERQGCRVSAFGEVSKVTAQPPPHTFLPD